MSRAQYPRQVSAGVLRLVLDILRTSCEANNGDWTALANDWIADTAGVSVRTVIRAINHLEDLKLITVAPRRGQQVRRITVVES